MRIIEYFWDVKNRFKASKVQKKLLERINTGDMVWAKMPLSDDELMKIKEGHRVRPYLVVKKDFFNIYAYACSSKNRLGLNNYETYMISGERYNKVKNSWIELSYLIKVPVNNLGKMMCRLSVLDLKRIEKKLQIQVNRNKAVKNTLGVETGLTEGDVISIGSVKYYVFDNNDRLHCYVLTKKLKEGCENVYKVKINHKFYYLYLDKKINLELSSKVKIIDMAYADEIIIIRALKKQVRKIKTEKRHYEVGSIFWKGNRRLIYLYEDNGILFGVDSIMYKVFPKIIRINNPEEHDELKICDRSEINNIVRYLCHNVKNLNKKVKRLYQEI